MSTSDPVSESELTRLAFEILRSQNQHLLSDGVGFATRQSFKKAILTAEHLMSEVRNRKREVLHAYQIFPCDRWVGSRPMNVIDIFNRFSEIGWTEGMGKSTVRTRVWEILEDVDQETKRRRDGWLEFLDRHSYKPPAESDIDGVVEVFLQDFAVPEVLRDVDQLRVQISDMVRRMLDNAMRPYALSSGTSESPTDPLVTAYFMKFLCGHDTLEAAALARRDELKIRPYELFLYAYQQGILKEQLTTERLKLAPDFVPYPEYTSSLSIMLAHGGASEALDQWGREEKMRMRRTIMELTEAGNDIEALASYEKDLASFLRLYPDD